MPKFNVLSRGKVVAIAAVMFMGLRAAAAPVSWTGLGDGVSWSDPANWSSSALPGPADAVTINVAANPQIVVTGVNPVIQSLNTAETIRFNAGTTFTTTTASSTAPLSIAGGFIAGGTWTFSGAGAFLVVGTAEGRLQNPAITGEVICTDANTRLRVGPTTTFTAMRFRSTGQSVAFGPGFVLSSQIIAENASTQAYLEITNDGTFTVGPTGSISSVPGIFTSITIGQPFWYSAVNTTVVQGTITNAGPGSITVDPAALTLSATGRIENTGTGTTNVGVRGVPTAWTNSGTLRVSAGTMRVQDTFTNAGTIQVAGGVFRFDAGWTNSGTIDLIGAGRLELNGTFSTSSIGTITRGGGGTEGTIAVMGQWNNTGATYNLTAATGSYVMDGGTITGGTINTAGGAALRFGGNQGILTGVNYTGQVSLDTNNSRVRVNAGTTLGGIRVSGSNAGASFATGYVINFPIVIEGNSSIGTFGLDSTSSGPLTLGPSCSITATGTWTGTVSFGPGWWATTASSVTNQGTINIPGPNRTLTLAGDQFTNQAGGSITAGPGVTVNAEVTGFNTNTWTNAGSISVTDSVLNLNDLWSNTGTFAVTNTTCNLDGIFVPASPLSLTRSGGTITITGQLNNAGATTNLGTATGSWRLSGGTIVGGTLGWTPTDRLIVTGAQPTIDSVAMTSELLLDESNARLRITGTTTAPSIRLRGVSAGVSFSNGYVISYPIISDSPTATQHGLDSIFANSTLTVGPAGSFTSAPGSRATISIGDAWWSNAVATLVNQGLIESSAVDRAISILPSGTFSNTGTVRGRAGVDINVGGLSGNVSGFDAADAGSSLTLNGNYTLAGTLSVGPGTTVTLRGTWANSGTIAINNGTLELDGTFSLANLGTFTNTNGTVNILGTLNNAAGLTLNAATGSWTLAGGTINGGTITQTQGSRLGFAATINTLNNVQFTSELVVSRNNGRVRLLGTSRAPSYRLTSQGAGLAFGPGYVMNETITYEGPGSKGLETSGAGTLTISASGRVLVTGGNLTIGGFWENGVREVNVQGLIEASNQSTNVFINSDTMTNYDTVTGTLTGGTWRVLSSAGISFGREIRVNATTLEYSGNSGNIGDLTNMRENRGTLIFRDGRDAFLTTNPEPPAFTNSGRLTLGVGSRLQIGSGGRASNFIQTPTGTVRFELGGTDVNTGYGSLRVFGQATLDGTVEAAYVNNFPRVCGQLFQVIDANSRVGQFATTNVPPVTEETVFLVFYGGADVRMTVSARADFNEDGFLDFFDYSEFVDCFEGNCPPGFDADFNGDGFVDFFDYLDFVFRFEAGCD